MTRYTVTKVGLGGAVLVAIFLFMQITFDINKTIRDWRTSENSQATEINSPRIEIKQLSDVTYSASEKEAKTADAVVAFLNAYLAGAPLTKALELFDSKNFSDIAVDNSNSSTKIDLANGSRVKLTLGANKAVEVYNISNNMCNRMLNNFARDASLDLFSSKYAQGGGVEYHVPCDIKTFDLNLRKAESSLGVTADALELKDQLTFLLQSPLQIEAQNQTVQNNRDWFKYNSVAQYARYVNQKPDKVSFVLNKFAYGVDVRAQTVYVGGLVYSKCKEFLFQADQIGLKVEGSCYKGQWNTLTTSL